jgi:hypothetical protein
LLNGSPYQIKFRSALSGTLAVLIVVGLWGLPALMATRGGYLQVGLGKHVLQRSFQPMESHGGAGVAGYLLFLPFYFVTSFFSFFPWFLFFPASAKRLLARREPDENYLLGSILIVLLVFTLVQTKLPHYVLPAYPMLAILVARQVAESKWRHVLLAGSLVLYCLIALVGFRVIEPEFLSKAVASRALPLIPPETRTASLNYDEQSLVWYLREKTRPFHRRLDSSDFSDFMNQPGPALCVINRESIDKVHLNPDWHTFELSGLNFARWKMQPVLLLGVRTSLPVPQSIDLVTVIKQ